MKMDISPNEVAKSYDSVADEYLSRIFHELDGKPLDRQLLDQFIQETGTSGIICDLGCGPGHVARYLKERGARVVGVDLSPRMVQIARRLNPEITFFQDDMLSLNTEDGSWDGIVAFYSIVNISPTRLPEAFREMKRTLRSGGKLLLAFHIGEDSVHLDEWWDLPVSIDFFFFPSEKVAELLIAAGLRVERITHRDPYPDVEHQSKRAYILCRKP